MTERIINLYKQVLSFAKLEADDKGYVWLPSSKDKEPFTVAGKQLVLPTLQHQKSPSEKTIFHPLGEHVDRVESDVIEKLKLSLTVQMNRAIHLLGLELLNLVASTDKHPTLNPEQSQLTQKVHKADEKTLQNWEKWGEMAIKSGKFNRFFVSLFLRRGGEVNGKRYSRAGIVNFPAYSELLEDQNLPKTIRVSDKQTFRSLLEFMFPDIDVPSNYCYGSHAHIAPFFDTLLNTSMKITVRINELCNMFGEHFSCDVDDIKFDDDFIEEYLKLEEYSNEIRLIPPQSGSDGRPETQKTEPVQQEQRPGYAQPVHHQQTAPTAQQKPTSYRDMVAQTFGAPAGMPMQQTMSRDQYEATRMPSWAMPQQQMMAPQLQVPMMQGYAMPSMPIQQPMVQGYGTQQMPMQQAPMVIVGYAPNGQPIMQPAGMPMQQPMMQPQYPQTTMMAGSTAGFITGNERAAV